MSISRRSLLQLPFATLAASAMAQEKPWRAAFLSGGFDGDVHHGGFKVEMQPGWKTYWRVPGAGGIPPDITALGTNIKEFIFEHPLPHRYDGEDGQSIGYMDEVIFPLRLLPVQKSLPIRATLNAFIGVCEVVCIPVRQEQQIEWQPTVGSLPDLPDIQRWRMRVPEVLTAGPVDVAAAAENNGKPALALTLNTAVKDIFVEASAQLYFAAPHFAADGLSAILEVQGAESASDLKGQTLRISLDLATKSNALENNRGVEQRLMVV